MKRNLLFLSENQTRHVQVKSVPIVRTEERITICEEKDIFS